MWLVCVQFADLNNDSSSTEDRCSGKLLSNENKSIETVDINSNALVEPNRETATDVANTFRDDGRTKSSATDQSTSGVSQTAAAGTDVELTSVAHMLDVASADNFRTLLAPSLTPPKTANTVTKTSDSTAVSDVATTAEDCQSAAETIAREIINKTKVHLSFILWLVQETDLLIHLLVLQRSVVHYRPRSKGDNTFGSVCVHVCLFVCGHSPVWTVWPLTLIFGMRSCLTLASLGL